MTRNLVYKSLIVKISECIEKKTLPCNYLVFWVIILEQCMTKCW